MTEYQPPAASLGRLGTITQKLAAAAKVEFPFDTHPKAVLQLASGELFYESRLTLDTDGSVFASQDPTGDSQTSIQNADGTPVDADAIPYFVLPEKNFYQQFGIRLGDIAAVIYRDKIAFAVFADEYGDQQTEEQLGEGSIALHRLLGHETITADGRLINEGIDSGVITIVFPGSGREDDPQTPAKINEIGKKLFKALGGN